jgi:hypothetical protein
MRAYDYQVHSADTPSYERCSTALSHFFHQAIMGYLVAPYVEAYQVIF